MKNKIQIIRSNPLFEGIEESDIMCLLTCLSAKETVYDKDSYILMADNIITHVGIIISGSANIIKEDYWGNRAIISKISQGEMFAEAYCCAEVLTSHVSVVACEKTEVLYIDYKKIITTCSKSCGFHNHMLENMVKILARKDIILTKKIEHLVKRTTKEKLLSYLSSQAISTNSNIFDIPFSRQELADYLSVDRSAMSNELCKLRDEGILKFNKNHFELI